MLSHDALVTQITALPTPVLTATLNRFGGSVGGSKQAAARWLADRIYSGAIAVADVLPANPAAPAPKPLLPTNPPVCSRHDGGG